MVFTLLQIVALVAVAACLYHSRAKLLRRNAQSWDSLLGRLRPDGCASQLGELCFSSRSVGATPAEPGRRIRNARVCWAIFANAGVLLEMADYASRNGGSEISSELLAGLRADALQVRLGVLKTLAACTCGAVQESLWMNVLRTQSAYAEMEWRITELLESNAADVVPSFVAAM